MGKDKRKLTEKELKRKDYFEKFNFEMQKKGYKMKNKIINTQKARYLSLLVMFPFMAVTFWIYDNVNGFDLDLDCISWGVAAAVPLLILCLFMLHELIHGITWAFFAKSHFHSIDFGIIWSSLSPYCTCSEPLRKWQYLLGTAMPTFILGGGAAAAAVMTNQLLLFFLAEYMILSGGGDFQIILKGMFYHTDKKEIVYCDHPYECGFVVFEK
ncbi:MAG: DUF3267 domain-containing protein [Lachnospiraceae bacterium]|nr:DUF3267 domain-containing protein [Lachnospiraceae bacterium]